MIWPLFIAATVSVAFLAACAYARSRDLDIWLLPYLRRKLHQPKTPQNRLVHIMLAVTDHYEPRFNNVSPEHERRRVDFWMDRLPHFASKHRDYHRRTYRHTFFFPEEEYREEHLDRLADLCRAGFGDVEIHLHHDHDTAAGLRQKLTDFKHTLHSSHGLLHCNPDTGDIEYAFIHGNWALDNSDGGRHCGVNNELEVLRRTGCYADFTLPSTPSRTQTRKVNSIYYAAGHPGRAKSHDIGVDVEVGRKPEGDLMLVQGPLALNLTSRKLGLLPRIESGELSGDNPPTPERARLWVREGIHVKGKPDWIFIKLHTHGCNERNMEAVLGDAMDRTLTFLETTYNDGQRYALHYVTAREMYNVVKAAEAGCEGDPDDFRTFRGTVAEEVVC
jgi:hypothetical protein